MRHVSCILLLEWSTTSQRLWVYRISVPYAQKDPRFTFEKRRGQPWEFWSLFSTIDGSTLPKDCVEQEVTGKTYNLKKKKKKKQVRDITSFPMRCMIIIRQIRQVYNRCKILIWFSMWCHMFLLPCLFINCFDKA